MAEVTVAEIAARLTHQVEAVARDLLPGGRIDAKRYWRCGSEGLDRFGGGSGGQSVCVYLSGGRAGRWCDFSNRETDRGDLLDLAARVHGLDKAGAVRWAKEWLGIDEARRGGQMLKRDRRDLEAERVRRRAAAEAEDRARRAKALEIWRSTRRGAGTVVEAYLRGRGIMIPVPASVRFVPLLRYFHPPYLPFPAMVSGFQDAEGRFAAIHCTWLSVEGVPVVRKYIVDAGIHAAVVKCYEVERPKLTRGPFSGSAIRLTEAREVLAVAEGIETGLSVAQVRPDWGVWVAGSVSTMATVPVPSMVRRLILLRDGDSKAVPQPDGSVRVPADESIARAAALHAELARDAGRKLEVSVKSAPAGFDFNSLLTENT